MYGCNTITSKVIDISTSRNKSAEAIAVEGDWVFFSLNNYTVGSPLVINQGVTTKLTFQASDIFYSTGKGASINYDYTLQKFTPQVLNDVFLVEIRFKAKCSSQNGYGTIMLESPTLLYNPIQASTVGVPKAANQEQFVSISVPVYIGAEVLDNGVEVKWVSESGNFSLYDVSFMIVKISSGK